MRRLAGTSAVALAVAAFLGSLSLVAWRQARALETLEALDRVRRETALSRAEEAELQRRIRRLESWARVGHDARERLGMKVPQGAEIVILAPEAGRRAQR